MLVPLLGAWVAEADSPMGRVRCTRQFERVLGGTYVELRAHWRFARKEYEERALFGLDRERKLAVWSFTSDGKQSTGQRLDVSDLNARAVGFESLMPAGRARQAYWPVGDDGVQWVVEVAGRRGWKRMVTHLYRRVEEA